MTNPDPIHVEFVARFRYFGNLHKLLKRRYRSEQSDYRFRTHPGIKDAIEAMGVPHTEVDVILVNNRSVDFKYKLLDRDAVDVYPLFTPLPAQELLHLSPSVPGTVTFVLDVHLGTLARRLRLLGFDCLYRNDFSDAEVMQLSLEQGRTILTCDRGILRHKRVVHGYLVRSDQVDQQVREVLARYQLHERVRPWLRCMACNGLMEEVRKGEIEARLEPKTRLYYDDFRRCGECDRLYWQGSHFAKINQWLSAQKLNMGTSQ